MSQYAKPHLAQSALITIDMQNDFTWDDAPAQIAGTADIIPNTVQLLEVYRTHALPVIHVVRLYRRDGSNVDLCRRERIESGTAIVAPDSEGAELVDELKPAGSVGLDADVLFSETMQSVGPHEYAMYKPRWGAFYGTGLETWLTDRDIDTLVITGCNYPNCPRTTIYEASERDFRVVAVPQALSQLTSKDETELENIGIRLMPIPAIEETLASSRV